MIAIRRNSGLLAIRTVFFAPNPELSDARADLIGCVQVTSGAQGFERVRTLHIDLARDTQDLFAALGKSTKNQVNRAANVDQVTCTASTRPGDGDIAAFRDFYNAFARAKGTTLCRSYQVETMRLLTRENGLVITRANDAAGRALCYHVYVADGRRAMLMYSGSHFRSARGPDARKRLGRANRLLHWKDILFFRDSGYGVYDFGGLTDDPRIEEFKRSFGGRDVLEYTGYVPVTWKGRLAARYRDVLCKVRRSIFSPPQMR